jgi:thiamine-monophosphate kinase
LRGEDHIAGDLGRAYRRPVARLREGEAARTADAHAMIDVSDGLALDLHRLADASGVGFDLASVPVATGATLEEALGGGEDYELLVAVAGDKADALSTTFEVAGLRRPVLIGHLIDDPSVRLLQGEPLARAGWQHRLG